MTMFLQNRTISMILTVPDVKELMSPLSSSVENLGQKSFSNTSKPPSIPIYHGSIIHIEQHHDNENTSDLIVRVPNFQHLSFPTVTISTINDQLSETERQQEARIKRRAPICPIRIDQSSSSNQNLNNQSEINSRLPNTKRLAIGLRNFTRVFTANSKSKQPTNINEITFVPVLPDVEVITENFQIPILSKKNTKNSTSKFLTPKILFIKRKRFQMKRKQPSSSSLDSQTNTEDKTVENSQVNISMKDNEIEQDNQSKQTIPIKPNRQVEDQSTSIINPESSTSHRYCTISGLPRDTQTLIPKEKIDFDTNSSVHTQYNDDNIDEQVYVVHPNGDTYSETYEITYELDPDYHHSLHHDDEEQIYLPEIKNQSSIKVNLDPHEYQDLASAFSTWLPISPPNNYEQIERDSINKTRQEKSDYEHLATKPKKTRVKFHSHEDVSQISDVQTSIDQPESISASLHETNQNLSLNDTSIINEDYTIIIQLLKHVLQLDTMTNDTCEGVNEFGEK